MKFSTKACGAIVAGVLALVVSAPTAHAAQGFIDNSVERKCQETIAKESGKFIKAWLKERAKCADKNLKTTGSCDFAKRNEKLDKAESKLRAGLGKKCGAAVFPFPNLSLAALDFPGKCFDNDTGDLFTDDDLEECIFVTHRDAAEALFDLQYGANGSDAVLDFETQTANEDLAKDLGKCQKELGKNGLKFATTVHKEITKCRSGLGKGSLSGFLAVDCGDNLIETKPAEKIAKAESKTIAKISDKCAGLVPNLDVCDTGGGPAANEVDAANCIVDSHRNAIDDPDNSGQATPFPSDLIDIEYALGAICGDGITNDVARPAAFASGNFFLGVPPEECDGADDTACPGACGAADSPDFPCLCTNTPRERVIEHDPSDLDNGWTGTSHDSTVIEGGGYVAELRDCDGPGGPDVLCTVGPSCALAPNQGCSANAQCGGVGNSCRLSDIDVGPRCSQTPELSCNTSGDCPGQQNFCRKTPHGIPLPLSSGGVAVCVVNVFSEHVVGTTNLVTGSSAVRVRQRSITHIGSGTLNQPCPSCGGFCSGTSSDGGAGPGQRTLCTSDANCPGASTCVTDAICSFGPNQDKACRRDPPFGNASTLFGTPSIDCSPSSGNDISGGGLDILFNPSTTGSLTTPPSFVCNAPGFGTKKCIAGTDTGKTCTVDSDCPGGGAGSCQGQCFCPAIGGTAEKPNDCASACRGGTSDYMACGADSDCPGGLCQSSSCRVAAGVCTGGTVGVPCSANSDCGVGGTCGDPDSTGEGFCAAGPTIGLCSFTTWKGCGMDSHCRPSGSCPECLSDNSETCASKNKDCFVSEGYSRTGVPGVPDRTAVAHYCIPASASAAVNSTAGLPGPGALEQPTTIVETGF